VGLRRIFLILLVALLGAGVVVLPAVAGSETTPAIEAENKPGSGLYTEEHHAWTPSGATIGAGAAVAISNPSAIAHGVRWVGGPATPSCSAGVPLAGSAQASGTKWSGTCTFSQPGTYVFYCTVHGPEMTATITVNSNGATTTNATTTPEAPSAVPGPAANHTPIPEIGSLASPLVGSAAQAVRLPASQRGRAVRGSVSVSQAGAGGLLEVDLLAKGASLAGAGHGAKIQVGRLVRPALTAGALSFKVPLSARGKRALRARGRLPLSVRVLLSPPHGVTVKLTRNIVLHA
jgi:plastocyanin